MKALLIATIVVGLGLGMMSHASDDNYKYRDGGKHHSPERMLERMDKKLNLSSDQKEQMMSIIETHHEKMQALHESMKADREEMRQQMMELMSDEQKNKFKKMKRRDKDGHGKRHHDKCDDD